MLRDFGRAQNAKMEFRTETRQQLCLKNKKIAGRILRKTFGLEIAKLDGSSVGL
jgi:hypothetical protein